MFSIEKILVRRGVFMIVSFHYIFFEFNFEKKKFPKKIFKNLNLRKLGKKNEKFFHHFISKNLFFFSIFNFSISDRDDIIELTKLNLPNNTSPQIKLKSLFKISILCCY